MSLNDCAYCGHTEAKHHAYPPITFQEAQGYTGCWGEIVVRRESKDVWGGVRSYSWNTPGCTCPGFVSPLPQLAKEIAEALQERGQDA